MPAEFLSTQDVARLLGVSDGRVRQLDARLEPARTPNGRRVYRRDIVEKHARERAAPRERR